MKKITGIYSSILSILLCMTVIVGATFALFTSTSGFNIAINAANVNIVATIDQDSLKTYSMGVEQPANSFELEGTATFDDETGDLQLDRIVPGDKVTFTLCMTNKSDVTVLYRVKWVVEGELAGALVATADGNRIGTSITSWEVWNVPTNDSEKVKNVEIAVELPQEVGDGYQGKSANITFMVEAVQGNAEVFDDTNEQIPVQTQVNAQTGKTETAAPMSVSANGFTAEIPAGTALETGATTATLVVTKADEVNTNNFTVAGAEAIGLNISIPEVAADNETPIVIKLTGILEPGANGVMLYHEGETMMPVASVAEVDADGEYYYDTTDGSITLATKSFSNFSMLVVNKTEVATETELRKAIGDGKSVILTADIDLTKTLMIKKNAIIDLNGFTLDGKVTYGPLFQLSSDTDPDVVINSSKSGARINADKGYVILGYGKAEFYNVEINAGVATSANGNPFNAYNDLTLGEGVVVNVADLGTGLISNNGKAVIDIDGAKFNVSYLHINGPVLSVNAASTVSVENAEFNIKFAITTHPYFINKPETVTFKNTAFNVTDMDAKKAFTFNETYTWVEAGIAVASADALRAEIAAAGNDAVTLVLTADIELDADETVTIAAGKNITLDLNGHSITGVSDQTGANRNMFDVRGTLTVKNGTLTIEHVGTNMEWNNSTNVFNVTAGGVLNIENATVKNLGGSDMGFCVHLNNWGEVTLNANNVVFESNYVAVRLFNSGNDKNNVTLTNCSLTGASNAFWVHNYTVQDFGGNTTKALTQQALLNFDIDESNTFVGNPEKAGPIRYGFTGSTYCDMADGLPVIA